MASGTGAPIYDSLIEERGDVLAQARKAAEDTRQTAAEALGWAGYSLGFPQRPADPRPPAPRR
jgi:hypothetical protein